MDASFVPYLNFLERELTPNRLRHSLGVMQVMGELTPIYGLDRQKALLVGLLHDAAKDLSPEQRQALIAEAGIPNELPYEQDYVNFQHGPVGAYFVQKELGLHDPVILDAITMHTFWGEGENYNTPLIWCLRFSDLLEPNRNWDERARLLRAQVPRLRTLVYSGQMALAAFFQLGLILRFWEETGTITHPNLRCEYHKRSTELGLAEAWLGF